MNIAATALAIPAFLLGSPIACATEANLEYFQDYEAIYLAACTKTRPERECRRRMEWYEERLGPEEFALLVTNKELLEVVSAAK